MAKKRKVASTGQMQSWLVQAGHAKTKVEKIKSINDVASLHKWELNRPAYVGEFYVQFVTKPNYTPDFIGSGDVRYTAMGADTSVMEAEINSATLDAWLSDKKIHILFYEAR